MQIQTPGSTPAAWTRTRTSPGPGVGGSRFCRLSTSVEPYCCWAIAFTSHLSGVLEHVVEPYAEDVGDAEGHFERRRVAALLDGDDGLAGDADAVGQVGLGHLAVFEAQCADAVGHLG